MYKTEPESKDKSKSASRFDASDSLVDIYTKETPGQHTLNIVKKVIKEYGKTSRTT